MKVLKFVAKRKDTQNQTELLGMISTLDINECLINVKHYCSAGLAQFILTINTGGKYYLHYLHFTEEEMEAQRG